MNALDVVQDDKTLMEAAARGFQAELHMDDVEYLKER